MTKQSNSTLIYVKAWNNKGNSLDDLGKHGDAIVAYDEAIKLDSRFTEAMNSKGVALMDMAMQEEAIKIFDEAIKIDPNHAEAWYYKGMALIPIGQANGSLPGLYRSNRNQSRLC